MALDGLKVIRTLCVMCVCCFSSFEVQIQHTFFQNIFVLNKKINKTNKHTHIPHYLQPPMQGQKFSKNSRIHSHKDSCEQSYENPSVDSLKIGHSRNKLNEGKSKV